MTEKEKKFLGIAADYFNALLVLVYAGLGYLMVCLVLDHIVPILVPTVKTAHNF